MCKSIGAVYRIDLNNGSIMGALGVYSTQQADYLKLWLQ
jgi:hypothetical protein